MTDDEKNRLVVMWEVGNRTEAMCLFMSITGMGYPERSFDHFVCLRRAWQDFLSEQGIDYPSQQMTDDARHFGFRLVPLPGAPWEWK